MCTLISNSIINDSLIRKSLLNKTMSKNLISDRPNKLLLRLWDSQSTKTEMIDNNNDNKAKGTLVPERGWKY